MCIISSVPPRTNMDNFYIDMNILTVKNTHNYNIGLLMYRYVNNGTDVFNNFFSNISDIHQHDTRNATPEQVYITSRHNKKTKKFSYCGLHFWNFIMKISVLTVQLVH